MYAQNVQLELILLIKRDVLLHHHHAHKFVEDVVEADKDGPDADNAANHKCQRSDHVVQEKERLEISVSNVHCSQDYLEICNNVFHAQLE